MKPNIPTGIHFFAEIYSKPGSLQSMKVPDLRKEISNAIERSGFFELGRLYFKFKGGGITGIISLRESHIAFHTWPELNYLTLDVYTCNYTRDNSKKAKMLFEKISKLFKPVRIKKHYILR